MPRTFTFTGAISLLVLLSFLTGATAHAQGQSYFIDGYHGGIWGHFPYKYASFIKGEMQKYPEWKVNLEIEPVTWDSIQAVDPDGYGFIRCQLMDSSYTARMEYVNPAYGQPYMFNISGESIIRQLAYGMRTLRRHFPGVTFSTYSSEEPCFTTALPGILHSFGFQYASLKNPNTCWGGYTAAHGGEMLQWVGPDGSAIRTVPRYATEKLEKGSTWQTNAWRNDPAYISDAMAYGIRRPVGMCLQDAGWTQGPWLGSREALQTAPHTNTTYTTWRHYFKEILKGSTKDKRAAAIPDWKLSQEDIHVSLVWGGQILQRVAAAVRQTENKLVSAEMVAALNHHFYQTPWPGQALDKAWTNLLLSQHHDTWIVPYNKKHGITWQQQVDLWTDTALHISDSILSAGTVANGFSAKKRNTGIRELRVYNTSGRERTSMVHYSFSMSAVRPMASPLLLDPDGHPVQYQIEEAPEIQPTGGSKQITLHFEATAPSLGYATYQLVLHPVKAPGPFTASRPPIISRLKNGNFQLETDLYKILVDPKRGGIMRRLLLKAKERMGDLIPSHEFLADTASRGIGELRGYFYKEKVFHSSQEHPATVSILTNGPLYAILKIEGKIGNTPFTQLLQLSRRDPLIRTQLTIDWQKAAIPGIGAYPQRRHFRNVDPGKAFYNSRYKLLTLFPVDVPEATVHKDAPFDIYQSRLKNTFYDRWDSIKNDVLLHWVNIDSRDKTYGFALFADATTSYAQGGDLPLGLTTQYIGSGLFGANYTVDGPTVLRYAFMPHGGDWKTSGVNRASADFNTPLKLIATENRAHDRPVKRRSGRKAQKRASFLSVDPSAGWDVTAFKMDGEGSYILRLFNAVGDGQPYCLRLSERLVKTKNITLELIDLNGRSLGTLPADKNGRDFQLRIPPLGLRTIKIICN